MFFFQNVNGSAWIPAYASAFSVQSSGRVKKNIKDLTDEDGYSILALRPVSYDYINEKNGTDCQGLIAEEVELVNKYPVAYENEEPVGIDYSKLVPSIIKLCQMQQDRIEELEARLEAIENEK